MPREYKVGDELVPGFRLSGFLGRGGFGQVWRCEAPGGAELALKIIDLDREEGLREYRALRLVKRIRHANLVSVVACWLRDSEGQVLEGLAESDCPTACFRGTLSVGRPAELIIAMGLGEKNLLDRLHECQAQGQQGIPPAELLDYLEDAARGLDFLNSPRHDLGNGPVAIQHCDIKPQNILIVGAAAQVCDFGLARVLSDVRQTRATVTAAYAAPECIQGHPPSPTTDQYSLAISYVELRTGRLPFADDASAVQILRAHLDGALDLSHLSSEEQEVIRRATSLDPDLRYPSASRLVRALRTACGVFPSGPGAEPRTQRGLHREQPAAARAAPARGTWLRSLMAAAAAALAVLLWWLVSRDGPRAESVARPLGLAAPDDATGSLSRAKPMLRQARRSQSLGGSARRSGVPSRHAPNATPSRQSAVAPRPADPARTTGGDAAAGASYAPTSGSTPARPQPALEPPHWSWLRLLRLAMLIRGPLAQRVTQLWNTAATHTSPLMARLEKQITAGTLHSSLPEAAMPGATPQPDATTVAAASLPIPYPADPSGSDHGRTPDRPIEQARQAAARGDLAEAIRLATLAIEGHPSDSGLYVQRAAWRAQQRDFEGALEDLRQARAFAAPGSVDLLFARLRVRVRLDDCPLVCPGRPVARLAAGTELVVTQADGEWLYVQTDTLGRLPGDRGQVLQGWIDRDDVEAIRP